MAPSEFATTHRQRGEDGTCGGLGSQNTGSATYAKESGISGKGLFVVGPPRLWADQNRDIPGHRTL